MGPAIFASVFSGAEISGGGFSDSAFPAEGEGADGLGGLARLEAARLDANLDLRLETGGVSGAVRSPRAGAGLFAVGMISQEGASIRVWILPMEAAS